MAEGASCSAAGKRLSFQPKSSLYGCDPCERRTVDPRRQKDDLLHDRFAVFRDENDCAEDVPSRPDRVVSMEKSALTRAVNTTIRFLFPDICMLCGRVLVEGDNCGRTTGKLQICPSCLSALPVRSSSERWFPCLSDPYEQDPIPDFAVWALFHYEEPVTTLLRRMKFNSKIFCGNLIGELLGREFPTDLPFEWDAIIPIPLSEKRLRTRGFNQSEILAGGLAKHLNIAVCNNVLSRTRRMGHQRVEYPPGG